MNPVKLFGGMLLVLGVCGMLLGSAMVPVSAPIWADEGVGGIGGGDEKCEGTVECIDINDICRLNGSGGAPCIGGCDTAKAECKDCICKNVSEIDDYVECAYSL